MDVMEKMVELLTNSPQLDVLDWTTGWEEAANYLIAHGVTVQEWISVDDRLPEEKVNCIVHYKHAYCNNDGYWAIGFCFYDGEKFQLDQAYKVTHWIPTLQPPKGVNDAESVD